MKRMFFSRMTIVIVVVAQFLASCFKDSGDSPTVERPKSKYGEILDQESVKYGYMVLKKNDKTNNWSFSLECKEISKPNVWIDFNNNGKKDEKEAITDIGFEVESIVQSQVITIYGEVTHLNCKNNSIVILDTSENTSLQTLNCANNLLSELNFAKNTRLSELHFFGNKITKDEMEKLIASLPNNTEGKLYAWKKTDDETNYNGNDLFKAIYDKGWTFHRYNGTDWEKWKTMYGEVLDPESAKHGYMVLKREVTSDTLKLYVSPLSSQSYVWVDFDNDGEKDPKDELGYYRKHVKEIVSSEVIVIYGKVELFECHGNKLTGLFVSENKNLQNLRCYNNSLTTLDVSKNTQLGGLDCSDNSLTTLDVSKNTQLGGLDCSNNSLTTLDVSKNIQLGVLYCSNNSLTTLDVSNNIQLKRFYCNNNSLTTLDVSKNTKLGVLECSNNSLTTLDVSKNTQLEVLDCSNNSLTTLDVSKDATKWDEIKCYGNKIGKTNMESLIASLPPNGFKDGRFPDFYGWGENENNYKSVELRDQLWKKRWRRFHYVNGSFVLWEV